MMYLRQSTASQAVVIGPFVDSTDGNTAETGLTIDAADIRLSKNGANIVGKNSGGGTHDELGYYTITLDATDTNTVGRLQLMVHESGALPVYHDYMVLEEAVYDNLFASSAPGPLAANSNGSGLTEAGGTGDHLTAVPYNASWDAEIQSEVTDALNAYDPPTRAELTSDTNSVLAILGTPAGADLAADVAANLTAINGLNDPTAAAIADAVWDEAQAGHVGAGSFGEIATEIASILVDTAEIGSAGAGLTAVPWNAAWDTEVQSEVTDALNAYDPPTNAELTAAVANVSVDEIQATALADLFNTDSGTTYASAVAGSVVKEIADNAGGSALTEAGIADAVWDEVLSGHAGAGSAGEALAAAGSGADAATIADAVWDEAQSGHVGAGTFGEIATEIASILVDTAEIGSAGAGLTAVPWNAAWDAEVQSEVADGLAAYDPPTRAELTSDTNSILTILGTPVGADLSADIAGNLTAINGLNDLDAAGIRTAVGLASANLDTQIAALPTAAENRAEMDTNSTELAQIISDIAALNNISAADVNAQVLDVLNTDTFAEPTGVPGATVTLATKIGFVYMALRNRIDVTASKKTFYDDAGNAEWEKDLTDDGTTYSESEANAI